MGIKQGGNSASGSIKINFSALNASLSTAKSYNQTFEGPNPTNTTDSPSLEQKPDPPQTDLPPLISIKESSKIPKNTETTEQTSIPKKTLEYVPKSPPEEFNNNKKPYYDRFNEQESPRYQEEHPRSKGYIFSEKPMKKRSLSPQVHKSHNPENVMVNKFPIKKFNDFGNRKTGLGKIMEPDILIDMRSAESTSIFDIGISELTTKLLTQRKIFTLFPLQVQSFQPIKNGIDLIGKAKTGTGKTMAFVLPLLEKLRELKIKRVPKIIVVSPTRELANQITSEFKYYGPDFRMVCCYGGVPLNKQIDMISRGLEIIVATPGRLLDLMGRSVIPLEQISTVVIDEADHMMDIGFKDDLDEILNLVNCNVKDMQLLFFSATMPPWIKTIASTYLKPNKLFIDAVGNENQTADKIKHYAIPCTDEDLEKTLELVISFYAHKGKALIFTDTKSHVAQLTHRLDNGINRVGCLHGDMSQYNRDQTIAAYKSGEINCLIATDVAARGLDIPNVELVFQVRPPNNIANYIHRSGRTGRVGRIGISVMMFNPREDNGTLQEIEKKASIEFERRGIPTQQEFLDLKEHLKEKIKEARLEDKQNLLNGRFNTKEFGASSPKFGLEDALAKVNHPQFFLSRSLLTGNSKKVTFLFVSKSNKKKNDIKISLEKMLDGVSLHTMAYTEKENGVLVDVAEEARAEVLRRIEEQTDIEATIPIFIPEHRFFSHQSNDIHSLNHGGKESYGKSRGGYQPKFHKTNSQSSQMNNFEKKTSYQAFNFFRNKKE